MHHASLVYGKTNPRHIKLLGELLVVHITPIQVTSHSKEKYFGSKEPYLRIPLRVIGKIMALPYP